MKHKHIDLSSIFGQFAGKEVPMIEDKIKRRRNGKEVEYDRITPADQNDPTLSEMRKAANDNCLKLRVWWPGIVGTTDFRTDRVNAHIEKCADGKWRVSDRFSIG
jgi:hypothetical protein